MRINDDFSRPVIVHASAQDWVPSPAAGVERRMLFRIGGEKARAISVVRYAPGSAFARHVHTGGEEFFVLDGVFQDDEGDYPAGSYVRNPPGTSHAPAAKDGATIFVRLWQFRSDDAVQLVRLPGEGVQVAPREGGSSAKVLFDDGCEHVRLEEWTAGARVYVENSEGLEILVVSGDLAIAGERMNPHDWARLPAGVTLEANMGVHGARVWMKLGPLIHRNMCAFEAAQDKPGGA